MDADGALAVDEVLVEVIDSRGAPVRFDESLAVDAGGPLTELRLETDADPVTVYLPMHARYTFVARGYADAGELVAYGEESHRVRSSGPDDAVVDLSGLLGDARLVRRTPVHALLPGQTLDVLLSVASPGRQDLKVLPADYEADYEALNAELVDTSDRGVRLRAGSRAAGDVVARATASGLVQSAAGAEPGSVTAELTIPFASDLGVDLAPPQVSSLAYDSAARVLSGVADDDLGVTGLEVFDGPVLLATSDPDAAASEGVPEVTFPGGGTTFVAPVELAPGTYELTVYATDFSRNQGAATLVVVVP